MVRGSSSDTVLPMAEWTMEGLARPDVVRDGGLLGGVAGATRVRRLQGTTSRGGRSHEESTPLRSVVDACGYGDGPPWG